MYPRWTASPSTSASVYRRSLSRAGSLLIAEAKRSAQPCCTATRRAATACGVAPAFMFARASSAASASVAAYVRDQQPAGAIAGATLWLVRVESGSVTVLDHAPKGLRIWVDPAA